MVVEKNVVFIAFHCKENERFLPPSYGQNKTQLSYEVLHSVHLL